MPPDQQKLALYHGVEVHSAASAATLPTQSSPLSSVYGPNPPSPAINHHCPTKSFSGSQSMVEDTLFSSWGQGNLDDTGVFIHRPH